MEAPVVVGCAVGLGICVDVEDGMTGVSVEVGIVVGTTVDVPVGINVGVAVAG